MRRTDDVRLSVERYSSGCRHLLYGPDPEQRALAACCPDMGELQPTHILLVLFVVILLFGGSRMSAVGKGLGEGIRLFKKGLRDDAPEEPANK
jgi:sec-independent protein translocase protein TatA